MKKILCILTLVVCTAQAADYYVSTSGNDSNSGTASSQWRYCPGMEDWSGSASLNPGDTVYFKNTDTWTGNTGKAVLKMTGGVTYDGESWGSGTRAVLQAGSDDLEWGCVVNCIRDDPSEPTVLKGFDVDGQSYSVTGVSIGNPWLPGDMRGATKRIENCIVHHCGRAGEPTTNYGILLGSENNHETHNIEVLDCIVYNTGRTGIPIYPSYGAPDSAIRHVLLRNCEVYNTGLSSTSSGKGISFKNNVSDAIIEFCYIHDTKIGIGAASGIAGEPGPQDCIVRYNVVKEVDGFGFYIQDAGTKSLSFYGNLVFYCDEEGVLVESAAIRELDLGIYNNTFFQNCTDSGNAEFLFRDGSGERSIELRNNIISSRSGVASIRDNDGNRLTHSDNLFYRLGGGTLVQDGGSSYSSGNLTTWEPTGLAASPGFKNSTDLPSGFTGTYGIDLQPDADGLSILPSEAPVNNAKTLAAEFSGAINLSGKSGGTVRQSPWDIGAYESSTGGGDAQIPEPPSRPRVVPDI